MQQLYCGHRDGLAVKYLPLLVVCISRVFEEQNECKKPVAVAAPSIHPKVTPHFLPRRRVRKVETASITE